MHSLRLIVTFTSKIRCLWRAHSALPPTAPPRAGGQPSPGGAESADTATAPLMSDFR
jgi:hypothetical protein